MGIRCRVTKRQILLALCALTIPAAASAQLNGYPPAPVPPGVSPRTAPAPAAVEDPWMARPAPQGTPWQSPAAEPGKSPALEPIDLPPAIEQGVDMIYIDEALEPKAVHDDGAMGNMSAAAWSGAPVDFFSSVNPIYTELRRGLIKYQQRWGNLPQMPVPEGPVLKPGL